MTKGVKGNAYAFDGIDDFIEIQNASQIFNFKSNQPYSISFWVKPTFNQQDIAVHENDILSKWIINDNDTTHLQTGYPFCIRYLNQNKPKRQAKWYLANWGGYLENCETGNKIISEKELTPETFQHIVFAQNKTELKLYLNGKLISTKKNEAICSTENNAPLRIGKRGGLKYQNHFCGVVDELRFYNVRLNEEEVSILFNTKK